MTKAKSPDEPLWMQELTDKERAEIESAMTIRDSMIELAREGYALTHTRIKARCDARILRRRRDEEKKKAAAEARAKTAAAKEAAKQAESAQKAAEKAAQEAQRAKDKAEGITS